MKSSLGFHTMTLFQSLTRKEVERLIKHFLRYQKRTGLIKLNMVRTLPGGKKEYPEYSPIWNGTILVLPFVLQITYSDQKDHGIRWTIRCNRQDTAYKEYIIEARINPKILGGVRDYITAADCNDMDVAITNFNRISKGISPLLRVFEHYTFKRIDYCINFSLSELAPGCTPEQVMELVRRGNIPAHFEKWMQYDTTSHRRKADSGSFYLKSGSVNINCYWKLAELQKRMEKGTFKKEPFLTQAIIDAAQDIIRFEVQCKYQKVYVLSKRTGGERDFIINKYRELLGYQACLSAINYYYEATIGAGDWFSLPTAQRIVKDRRFNKQKEERLLDALREVSQCRSIESAKAKYQGSDLDTFKRTLKDLTDIGINPVTIPRKWGISHIPNLLHTFNDMDYARMACPNLPLI